jgi:hypothetical protein
MDQALCSHCKIREQAFITLIQPRIMIIINFMFRLWPSTIVLRLNDHRLVKSLQETQSKNSLRFERFIFSMEVLKGSGP